MRKTFFLAAATLLLVASSAFAGPTAGQLGLGTSHVSMTPIGIRYWASQQVGIDVEVGFWIFDTTVSSDPFQEKSVIDLQLGIPINVWECSDVWLHFRPFVVIDLEKYEDYDNGTTTVSGESFTNLYFGGALEMEAWLLECLSFSVSHGISVNVNDGGDNGDSTTDFHSFGNSLGEAGFHLYF